MALPNNSTLFDRDRAIAVRHLAISRFAVFLPIIATLTLFASILTPLQSAFATAPTITSFTPASGGNGTRVVITGTDFSGSGSCAVNRVRFGGTTAASYVVNSATQITATVSTGSTGIVDVRTAGGGGCGTGSSTGTFTWTATTYTVTYDGNGSTSGLAPVDGTTPYASGSTVTVLGNTGSLAKIGYSFSNWNTAADGSGTSYAPGNTFAIGVNTVLYAQWAATYSVGYNSNGATGGSIPVDGSSPYVSGATVTVLGNTGSLVRTGNTFANWNTAADGSGTSYTPGATFAITANTVLFAQWRASVTYNGNGSTGGTVPVDGASPYLNNSTVTVLGNTGSLVKVGYVFSNWNTAANGSGNSYFPSNTFAISTDTVLYAQWTVATYTVTYSGNGASSGMVPLDTSSPYANGATVTVLANTGSLTKIGYAFVGWNTAANGSGSSFSPGATFTIGSDTVLYAQWTITYTVTYNGNGKTGGSSPTVESVPYLSGATVTVLGNTGSLVRTGNTFDNWNTAANGTGIQYAPGDTFVIGVNTILYAQWRASVTYDGNGATGGTFPVDGASPYLNGVAVTVLGNTGSLVKAGYIFANWNTAADGSGTSYLSGDTFVIPANTVLYAQWTLVTHTVTYNGNGATSGTAPVDGASPYASGATVTVLGNTGALARTGHAFVGWNTAADGSGTSYAPTATFIIASDTVLYAKWVTTYTVTYDEDGATGGTVPVDGASPYVSGATVTVLGNTGSLTRTGYAFAHWNTAFNGSGTSYSAGDTFAIGANMVLYPQWTPTGTYTVTYSGNGATSGTVPSDGSSPYASGATVTVLGNTGSLAKTGYTFASWNTAANGSGSAYAPADTFAIAANVILYAQWSPTGSHTVTYSGNGSTGGTVPVDSSSPYIDDATVTVLGNTGSLTRATYRFAHWNTTANGSGTSYTPGATFTIDEDIILYAQWTAAYSVIYDEDGSTGGSVPIDGSSPYLGGATVTVLANTGSLVRTGNIFDGWNTELDGSGTSYAPGATFTISASTVLYPRWRASLTYDGNGSTSGTAPIDGSSPYLDGTTVTVLGNAGSLAKSGYTFAGWNTAANGLGTSYSPGNTFSISTNTVLYAKWSLITYTVTYNSNGATSGVVPVDGSSPYANGTTVTVLGNTGSLARTGYAFVNWNTAADGSGNSRAPGSTFSITANTVLYAHWIATYTVIYRPAGSTGGIVPVGATTYQSGATVTVLGNSGSLVRTGTTFDNWNTAVDGSGTTYAQGDTFIIGADTLLFALWRATVTYYGNGSTGGTVPVDPSSPYLTPYINYPTVTVLGNTGSLVKTGYAFSHWNTAANGSGTSYAPTDTFLLPASISLYAQWSPLGAYTVTYHANGATSGVVPVDASSPYANGASVAVLGNTGSLARTGYSFIGWNTAANGLGTSYVQGQTFAIATNTSLYARWTPTYTVTYDENGSTGGTIPVDGASPYASGATVIVLGNSGSLVRTGNTFAGWNTALDGSGTFYAPGNTFTIAANTVLYSEWRATLTYNANGATGGSIPVDGASPYLTGTTVTVLGNTGSLYKTGYTFVHWNSSDPTSGVHLEPGDRFEITANTVLYAEWVPIGTHVVAYSSLGATAGSPPMDASSPYLDGSTITVLGNTGLLVKSGFLFTGWNTEEDGTGTSYVPGITFTLNANTILYPEWTLAASHTVFFDGGGSTGGATASQTANVPTVLTSNGFTRVGYTFVGWNTLPFGGGSSYADGATYAFTSDITLYAQWTINVGGRSTVQPGPPIATVEVPVTHLVISTIESTVEASIAGAGGVHRPVAVTVPVGAVTEDVTIAITPAATSIITSTGVVSINLTAKNAAGVLITHFNKPLVLNLGQMAAGTTVAFSQDGIVWTKIQLLSGTTLPNGVHEGYYLAADGSVVILTDHLTYFGLKQDQAPFTLFANASQIPLGAFAAIYSTGGSGSGAGAYLTTTPAICSVNQYGLVIGLKVGTCTVLATKTGDGTYLNASTAPLDLTFIDLAPPLPSSPSFPRTGVPVSLAKSVTVTGATLSKLIKVNLGPSFGGKTVTIQIRKIGTTTYKTLCVVTLNQAGLVRTTRQVPFGSAIRVLLGGKSQAVTVVR